MSMPSQPSTQSSIEVVNGVSVGLVGVGIVTIALFPLALPILILTAVSVVPFLIPLLALGLLAAVVAFPIWLIRSLRRLLMRRPRPSGPAVLGQRLRGSPW
jgi:hypothetical protein